MKTYERNGLKVTRLPDTGSEFFPILNFKVEVQGEKARIDRVDPVLEINRFMYLVKQKNIVEAYYYMIV